MKEVREKLVKILEENGNYPKVKEKVEEFIGKISKIEEGAKEATKGATTAAAIGNAVKNEDAQPADVTSVNSLIKGIKDISDVVLKEGKADATKTGDTEQKSIGKLFGGKDNDGTEAQAAAASASIGAISGADILKAISVSGEASGEPTIEQAKNAAEIAAAKKEDSKDLNAAKKDAVIAAGIALRAMAKNGKFVAKNNEDKSANAINGTVASAVNKVLSTLIIAIRNTVDLGLKEINKVLGEIKQGEGTEAKAN